MPLSAFIVDDDPDMCLALRMTLEADGFDVVGEAAGGEEAVQRFLELDSAPSVVVLDERMPGLLGLEAAQLILYHQPEQVVVLFSAALDADVLARALEVGVAQCVDKLDIGRLPGILRVLLGR
jgi:DNA-binding NarL/FixJ family response regulator